MKQEKERRKYLSQASYIPIAVEYELLWEVFSVKSYYDLIIPSFPFYMCLSMLIILIFLFLSITFIIP